MRAKLASEFNYIYNTYTTARLGPKGRAEDARKASILVVLHNTYYICTVYTVSVQRGPKEGRVEDATESQKFGRTLNRTPNFPNIDFGLQNRT